MRTHTPDLGAEILFCPDTGHMTIRFSGPRCQGMPPFSNEFMALARGARSVTVDLSGLELDDPDGVRRMIIAELQHTIERVNVVIGDGTTEKRLQPTSDYYVG